jgi:hypothetical protein
MPNFTKEYFIIKEENLNLKERLNQAQSLLSEI